MLDKYWELSNKDTFLKDYPPKGFIYKRIFGGFLLLISVTYEYNKGNFNDVREGMTMEQYGKVFKKSVDNKINLFLNPYAPDKEKYFEIIKVAKSKGLKQVIINSELMTKILFYALESNGVILKINLSDSTDQEIIDNINSIVPKIRTNPLLFSKLKDELDWAIDSGSIDITSIQIFILNQAFQIYSNGIVSGPDISELFNQIMKPVIGKYFNAG